MKRKIIFQKCNVNNLYFLFHVIIACLNYLIEFYIYQEKIKLITKKENIPDYYLPIQMLILYIQCLSDFLAIIPYLIGKILGRKKEQWIISLRPDSEINRDSKNLIYTDISKKKSKRMILPCALIGTLDFLQKFVFVLYYIIVQGKFIDINTFTFMIPFEITLQFICSYLILKIHFYKLQYFSLFLNLGIFIIILILDIIDIKLLNPNKFEGNAYFFYAFNIIFISIEFSYVKKILLDGFISIYLLMIIKGTIVLIFTIIFSVILFFIRKDDLFTRVLFLIKHAKNTVFIILHILFSFLENLFAWLIIDKFSPNYYPFALIFKEIGQAIIDAIQGYKDKRQAWDLALRIILYIFSAICAILHNEIVVINVCNLGSDTRYFLDLQVEDEGIFSNTDDIEIIRHYETMDDLSTEKKDD